MAPKLKIMGLGAWPCIALLVIQAISLLPVHVIGANSEDATLASFQHLYNFYKASPKATYDCKVTDDSDEIGARNHQHWGTMRTLEFLTGKSVKGLSLAEKLISMSRNLERLRKFLARIGYLTNPGSLVFMDKQAGTLRLNGCPEGAGWRMQGENGEDKMYQEKHYTGGELRQHAQNPVNYIHKYTCYSVNTDKAKKCTHTFYVITKLLPELPNGFQIREGSDVTKEYEFACGVPYCNVHECDSPGKPNEKIPRRSFPPYEISWQVPDAVHKNLDGDAKNDDERIVRKPYMKNTADYKKARIAFHWDHKVKKEQKVETYDKDATPAEWTNAFGDVVKDKANFTFHSYITITDGAEDMHDGLYECIITDGNGVVSTPNFRPSQYLGDTIVNVMPKWQIGLLGVAAAIFILVFLLAKFICPRKMEHDDGTPYTKDDLVTPAKGSVDQTKSPEGGASKAPSELDNQPSNKTIGSVRSKQSTAP